MQFFKLTGKFTTKGCFGLNDQGHFILCADIDCLCGLVVSVPGYRARDPGSVPDATRFSEK
jgi:hypothetical protein